MEKKQLTPEQIYKRNQIKSKVLKIISPIVFWGFLALSIACIFFAIRNSFGNIAEMMALLDSQKFTGAELEANYNALVHKYGEWVIGTGGSGFQITFVNVGNALFSGLMIVNCIMSVAFLVSAFVLGKWIFPRMAEQITQDNQDMVNLTILKNNK